MTELPDSGPLPVAEAAFSDAVGWDAEEKLFLSGAAYGFRGPLPPVMIWMGVAEGIAKCW